MARRKAQDVNAETALTRSPPTLTPDGSAPGGKARNPIVPAKVLLSNWRGLRRAVVYGRVAPKTAERLTKAILAAADRLPKTLDCPGRPGHIIMSLLRAGATPADLRAYVQDLAQGECCLARYVAGLKNGGR